MPRISGPAAEWFRIIGAVAVGALPFMVADAILAHRAPIGRRPALRDGLPGSLGIAVALDPARRSSSA